MADNTASWIAAGTGLMDNITNVGSQLYTNLRNEKLTKEMYERQLRDNKAQWHMQNSYNSPTAQMARLREAGLNPHLIYGGGSGGGTASPMPSASGSASQGQAPRTNFKDSILAYQNVRQQEATTNNLIAQNDVIKQEANLKVAQIAAAVTSNSKNVYLLQQAKDLSKYALDAAKLGVDQQQKQLDYTAAQTQNTQAQTKNAALTGERQELENRLLRMGINPSDPTWMRAIAQFMQGNQSISDIISKIRKNAR